MLLDRLPDLFNRIESALVHLGVQTVSMPAWLITNHQYVHMADALKFTFCSAGGGSVVSLIADSLVFPSWHVASCSQPFDNTDVLMNSRSLTGRCGESVTALYVATRSNPPAEQPNERHRTLTTNQWTVKGCCLAVHRLQKTSCSSPAFQQCPCGADTEVYCF